MEEKEWMTVKEVAADIGCNPQNIRVQARIDPKKLGFPVCIVGTRIYIPRSGYEKWKEGN